MFARPAPEVLVGSKPAPSSRISKRSVPSSDSATTTLLAPAACFAAFCIASRQQKYTALSTASR